MPRITEAELRELLRRRSQPREVIKQWRPGQPLEIFVRGKLVNTMNKKWGWRGLMGYRDRWKSAIYNMLLAVGYRMGMVDPASPKRITIVAHVPRGFDSKTEGLRASLKPIPDSMKEAQIIDDDGDLAPHQFSYEQVVTRERRGVYIKVEFLG